MMNRKTLAALYNLILVLGVLGFVYGAVTSAAAGAEGGSEGFIATAAYGSYIEPHVMTLKTFSDRFILTNRAGKTFLSFYYRASPPLAQVIAGRAGLRVMVRICLLPLIGFAALALKLGVFWTLLLVMGIPGAVALFLIWLRRLAHRTGDGVDSYIPRRFSAIIDAGRLQ